MKATELRIGNKFRWKSTGKVDKVKSITNVRGRQYVNGVNISDCDGVALTEERMQELGLMFDPENRMWSICTSLGNYDFSFEIFQIPEEEYFFYKELELLYVHHLQNLFFVLTGGFELQAIE